MTEELEKKLIQLEKKREDRKLVHSAYEKNVKSMKKEIAMTELK